MARKKCQRCGYENVGTATLCFRCSACVQRMPLGRIIKPYHHELKIKEISEEDTKDDLETTTRDMIVEKPISTGSRAQYNAALICLRCGAANQATAKTCLHCGAHLTVHDENHHLRIIGSARSNIGQVRSNNEDNAGMWARHGILLTLVADGMGGAVAGEVASRLAKEAVQASFAGASRGSETLRETTDEELREKMRLTLQYANEAMLSKINEDVALQGMGTTATLAIVRGNKLTIAHIGDSRAYLVRGKTGRINQITDDHSFVEALIASGHITPAQAAIHPMRSVLYRALGQPEITDADLYYRTLEPDDRIVLCSDGLPRHVTADEIAEIAMASEDPAVISQDLIDLANKNGGEDNVTVAVLLVQQMEPAELEIEELLPVDCEDLRANGAAKEDANKTAPIPNIGKIDTET